jgi:SAM-dependent methyltransferase
MNVEQQFVSWEEAVAWLQRQPERAQLVLDCYYDDPLIEAARRYAGSPEWQAVRTYLPKPAGRALDIGAGRGIASYALAREGFEVTALEPDPSALVGAAAVRALASESGLPIEVSEAASEALPFTDNRFDLIFARAVLHHTCDLEQACREYHRVLKPGGCFIAIREHVISREDDLGKFLDTHPLHNLYGGEHAYRLDSYIHAIRGAGLRLSEVIGPWSSAINYAPNSLDSVKDELSRRVSLGSGFLFSIIRVLLSVPVIWAGARFLLNRVDNRPGRLYSFVARKI